MSSTICIESSEPNTPGTSIKASCVNLGTHIQKAVSIDVSTFSLSHASLTSSLDSSTRAVVLSHSDGDNFEQDMTHAISEIRRYEKLHRSPLFVVLSVTGVSFCEEAFLKIGKLVCLTGFDGLLISTPPSVEFIEFIRLQALGLRGRRVKLLVHENCEWLDLVDGIVVVFGALIPRLLAKQKMIFTSDPSLTHNADVLLSPHTDSGTPPTSVPPSPISGHGRSFLLREVAKKLTPATRLIVALSDEGTSVCELSTQGRLAAMKLPTILGLSAAESTCRYMGCLFGVLALQTASFISVQSVVANAIEHAKERGLISTGDEILIVLQPPPVTASTNESCFEGIVQTKIVQ